MPVRFPSAGRARGRHVAKSCRIARQACPPHPSRRRTGGAARQPQLLRNSFAEDWKYAGKEIQDHLVAANAMLMWVNCFTNSYAGNGIEIAADAEIQQTLQPHLFRGRRNGLDPGSAVLPSSITAAMSPSRARSTRSPTACQRRRSKAYWARPPPPHRCNTRATAITTSPAITTSKAFLQTEETQREVIAVRFDENSQVQSFAQYGLEDGRVIDVNSRQTPLRRRHFRAHRILRGSKGTPDRADAWRQALRRRILSAWI
jgi:hypothetical protein